MSRRNRRRGGRGQSLVEFALILPIMLAFVGGAVDFARAFQVWITLESATRDGAEYAATNATSATDALNQARAAVCTQAQKLPGFTGTGGNCSNPTVGVVEFSRSTAFPGSASNPLTRVTIHTELPFDMLFPYPFLNQGHWTITSTETYSIIQGRG